MATPLADKSLNPPWLLVYHRVPQPGPACLPKPSSSPDQALARNTITLLAKWLKIVGKTRFIDVHRGLRRLMDVQYELILFPTELLRWYLLISVGRLQFVS